MADVTGIIGNESVELNNAATEATLRLLLQATTASDKKTKENIAALAQKSGLDPAKAEAFNAAIKQTGPTMNALGKTAAMIGGALGGMKPALDEIYRLSQKLAANDAQASDLFASLGRIPGPLGLVAKGFQQVAKFQEDMLQTYRELSKAGVNFSGSLTEMRMAASQTYMKLSEFSEIIKVNSDTLSRMGTTANEGAKAFVNASNQLLKSETGDNLRALGFTTKEVNQGMIDYIAITGGRSKKEMQNTDALAKGTAAYLTELDALAQITGKTKEEQEKAMKEASKNAAWEAFMASLSPEEAAKATKGLQEALAKGGKGAGDAFQSAAMGLPPMTQAAREYTVLARNMNNVTLDQAGMIKDNTKTLEDMKKAGNAYSAAAVQDKKTIEQAGKAIIMSGGSGAETMSGIFRSATQAVKQGTDTLEGANKQREEVEKNQAERTKSQAAQAAQTEKSLQELGQKILSLVLPALEKLMPVINGIAQFAVPIAGATAAIMAFKGAMAVREALQKRNPMGTPANPMYTKDAGSMPGGGKGGLGDLTGGGKGKGLGNVLKGLGKGGAAAIGGMVLGGLADSVTESGYEKTGSGLDIASSALEFGGTGAMIGSVIPGLGTAVGGGIGAAIGGIYGLYKNWNTLFGGSGNNVPKPEGGLPVIPGVKPGTTGIDGLPGIPIPGLTGSESFSKGAEQVNTKLNEVIKLLKEISENTKETVRETKNLNGNLF